MPLSQYSAIPVVMQVIQEEKPRFVLDVGIGMGTYGMLCRGLLDWAWERYDKDRYEKQWCVIDGFEIFEGYHNPIWDYCYTNIWIGDAAKLIMDVKEGYYSVILLNDVLEHMNSEDRKKLIFDSCRKTGKYVVATSPVEFHQNDAFLEINQFEMHVGIVELGDFPEGTELIQTGEQNIFIYRRF